MSDNEIEPCTKCGSTDAADDSGRCLTCGCARVGNKLAQIIDKLSAEDRAYQDSIIADVSSTRGPLDAVDRLRIADYAFSECQRRIVARRIEQVGPRETLVVQHKVWSERASKLAAELPPVLEPTPSSLRDVSTEALIARIVTLLGVVAPHLMVVPALPPEDSDVI